MLPIVCIVGKQGSGKTALLERLVPAFRALGRRVAVVKHASHGFQLDRPGSDSWRLARAGAELVALSGPGQVASLLAVRGDLPLESLAALLGLEGYDLLLAEGYKGSPFPKVEVHRAALGPDLLLEEARLAAVVSDGPRPFAVPTFRPEDAAGLAAHLDELYVRGRRHGEGVRLVVNGREVSLNPFASAVIARGVLGMVSALRDVGQVEELRLEVRRRDGDAQGT